MSRFDEQIKNILSRLDTVGDNVHDLDKRQALSEVRSQLQLNYMPLSAPAPGQRYLPGRIPTTCQSRLTSWFGPQASNAWQPTTRLNSCSSNLRPWYEQLFSQSTMSNGLNCGVCRCA